MLYFVESKKKTRWWPCEKFFNTRFDGLV